MKRILLLIVALGLATPAFAQSPLNGLGYWKSVTAPVFAGGPFTGQLTGPGSTCAVPAYAFTGSTSTGLGSDTANAWCLSANGVAILRGSSTAVTSTVPLVLPRGTNSSTALNFGTPGEGIYSTGANGIDISLAAVRRHAWDQTSYTILSDIGSIFFGASADLSISRESAAVLQMGVDAAGVTDQMLKGPDRITSDGVGGNLTFAGGRNRGASAGGSIIFQTAPAAGAGVTGTLADRVTILSTGNVGVGASPASKFHVEGDNSSSRLQFFGDGAFELYNTANTRTLAVGATGDVIILGSIALGNTGIAISPVAPTAAGTGMAFTVGTGSTSFDWSITITTANAQSAFVLTIPTIANAWTCTAKNFTLPLTRNVEMTARAATTATLTNIDKAGTATAFVDGQVIIGRCTAH